MMDMDIAEYGLKTDHRELENQLQKQIGNDSVKPLFIWGAPGIGKSYTVKKIAEDKGITLVDRRLSTFDPSDIKGIPTTDEDECKWLPPSWLPDSGDNGRGVLFLDELNLAPKMVQSSAYQLILDGQVGNYKMPGGWSIIAAGNRSQDNCGVFSMSPALKDRFRHIELKIPRKDDWLDWAMKHELDPRIIGFIQSNPSALFSSDESLSAFPTPRSWEGVSNLIKGETEIDRVIKYSATEIGTTATEFKAHLESVEDQLEPPEAYLNNPEKAEITEKDLSLQYAMMNNIAYYFEEISLKEGLDKVDAIFQIIEDVEKSRAITFLKTITRHPAGDKVINTAVHGNEDREAIPELREKWKQEYLEIVIPEWSPEDQ